MFAIVWSQPWTSFTLHSLYVTSYTSAEYNEAKALCTINSKINGSSKGVYKGG